MTSGDLNIDLSAKTDPHTSATMISDDLSNHFFFGFSLGCLGAELEERVLPPPPHQVVENLDAHQVAVEACFVAVKYLKNKRSKWLI